MKSLWPTISKTIAVSLYSFELGFVTLKVALNTKNPVKIDILLRETKPLWLWKWHHQNARVFECTHIYHDWLAHFQQTVGIIKGTYCVPLLVNMFLYSYIMKGFLRKTKRSTPDLYFHIPLYKHCIIQFLWLDLPVELEIKNTTDTARFSSYLDIRVNMRTGCYEIWLQERWFQLSNCEYPYA